MRTYQRATRSPRTSSSGSLVKSEEAVRAQKEAEDVGAAKDGDSAGRSGRTRRGRPSRRKPRRARPVASSARGSPVSTPPVRSSLGPVLLTLPWALVEHLHVPANCKLGHGRVDSRLHARRLPFSQNS
jgi:hypothetical protein